MRSSVPPPTSILVHECVTGGGWLDPEAPPPSLAREGAAMLGALLADFRAWGRHPVTTTVDSRLRGVAPLADRVIPLDPRVYPTALPELAAACGAALIVAPEMGGMLERLSARALEAGARLVGSSPEAIAVAADKWECHRLFRRAGLPTPETVRVEPAEAVAAAMRAGFPLVVKPMDGAGCEGVGLIRGPEELERALAQPALRHGRSLLLQRYVPGVAASVSLLVGAGRSVAVSLNLQRIHPGIPFEYRGGVACVFDRRRTEAFDLARRAVALVPGLLGYVGVDLVLTDDGCSLVEINPRVTTSYVGLRRTVHFNLAEAMWEATQNGVLPADVVAGRRVSFGKEDRVEHCRA